MYAAVACNYKLLQTADCNCKLQFWDTGDVFFLLFARLRGRFRPAIDEQRQQCRQHQREQANLRQFWHFVSECVSLSQNNGDKESQNRREICVALNWPENIIKFWKFCLLRQKFEYKIWRKMSHHRLNITTVQNWRNGQWRIRGSFLWWTFIFFHFLQNTIFGYTVGENTVY